MSHTQGKLCARRIVAAWNACEGISMENLERGHIVLTASSFADEKKKQQEELITALKYVAEQIETHPLYAGDLTSEELDHLGGDAAFMTGLCNKARAAIAKAEGKYD